MKFLLDTDHISILQKQSGQESRRLMAASLRFHLPIWPSASSVSTSKSSDAIPISLKPRLRPISFVGTRCSTEYYLRSPPRSCCLSTDNASAVFNGLIAQRVRIATMDLRIASIALSQGLTLLTRNSRDFSKVPHLVIEDWTI